jgi:hypothetical protein
LYKTIISCKNLFAPEYKILIRDTSGNRLHQSKLSFETNWFDCFKAETPYMIPNFTVLAWLRCSRVTSSSGTLNTFEAVDL